ncbi:MAG: hypothetical protein AAF197_03640 [Pseudomonadota bacterium]
MQVNWQHYSLKQLHDNATQSFRAGGGSRPDVLLIEINDQKAVLKDQNSADPWFARIVGPLLNWRECKGLRRLVAASSIPNLLAVPDTRSFLMSFHESQQITRVDTNEVDWEAFFSKLKSAIDQIHALGVAHNDLRNPSNILITKDGDPILVDLVACFCRGRKWNLINRWLFNKFCQVDHSAVTKLKQRVAPHLVLDSDIHAEAIAGRTGMSARRFGQWVRKVSRQLFTK